MRALLTPRWIVLHVVLLGVVPVMLWLGWWQWRGGLEGHSPQTTGYAFQWWIFALFAVALWARLVRDELRRQHADPTDGAAAGDAGGTTSDVAAGAAGSGDEPSLVPYIRYEMPIAAPAVQDDTELGRYNEYLAQLNAQESHSTGDDA